MKLNDVCNEVASKALSTPGIKVECMKEASGWLEVGNLYKVSGKPDSNEGLNVGISGEWYATRFRKAK